MILIRTLISRISCLKITLVLQNHSLQYLFDAESTNVPVYCIYISLSLARAHSLAANGVSVCKVCQGPLPHSAISFSKLKVKSNRLCGYTSYINVMNISVAMGGKGRDSSLYYAYENSKYLNRMFNFRHFDTILRTSIKKKEIAT